MNEADFTAYTIACTMCKQPFVFEVGEQIFYQQRGYYPPRRCRDCRAQRKVERAAEQLGG